MAVAALWWGYARDAPAELAAVNALIGALLMLRMRADERFGAN